MPSGGGAVAIVLAGEQAAGDRVVGNHPDALLAAEREQLALELAEQQVVARLHAVEARQAAQLAAAERAGHLVGEVVRAADVAGLAGAHHVSSARSVSSIGVSGSEWWSW